MDAGLESAQISGETPTWKKPPEFNATICNVVAVELHRYLKALGLNGASVLQAAGLKRETLNERYSRFPVEQLAAALKISARNTKKACFGLHFGEWYNPRVLNACNYAFNSAPNLRKALISLQDHLNLVAGIPTQLTDQDDYTELSWVIELASMSPRHVMDFKAMRTLKFIQQTTGPEWRPLRVNLAYEEPDNVDEHIRIFGPNVQFNQPVNSFQINSSVLALPMPDADPDIFHMAYCSMRNPFASIPDNKDPIDQFRRFIRSQLGKNSITMAAASKHMILTQQQLRRLLKKHGTCFQCVLKQERMDQAAYYLRETETRFSEISYLLGFSDQSTFSRSVKRWFGKTPRYMRRNGH